jgi:hypothetical protein
MKLRNVAGCGGFKPIFKFLLLSEPLKGENLKTALNPPQPTTNSNFEVKR